MNRFLLVLASMKDIRLAPLDADTKTNKFAAGQHLVIDETQRLLATLLRREHKATEYYHTENDEALHVRIATLVKELLSGYNKMDSEHLRDMAWINPVLLESCIQSKNEEIRLSVQKLVKKISASSPAAKKAEPPADEKSSVDPSPTKKTEPSSDEMPSTESSTEEKTPAQESISNGNGIDEITPAQESISNVIDEIVDDPSIPHAP
jgi:hypothetical protein